MKASTLLTGALVGAAAVGAYFWLRPAQARYPMPKGPLRPPELPPDAPPPGPLASKFDDFIGGLSDAEVINLRGAVPSHWWDLMAMGTTLPSDELVVIAFNPARIDYAAMDDAQRSALQSNLIDAIGWLNALELQSLLQEAQVM